jgi:hypothetical protein
LTYPITPLPSIHQDIFDAGLALEELRATIHLLEKLLARLAHDILIGVVNAILRALGLGEFVGPVDSLIGMLGHLEAQIRSFIANPLATLQSDINQLIGGVPGGVGIQDLVNLIIKIAKLISDWLSAFGLAGVGDPQGFVHLLRGLFPAALPQFNGTVTPVSIPGFTNIGNGLISYTPQNGIDAVSHLIQQVDGTVITAAHAAQQAVSAATAAGVNVGSAVAAGQQAIDHAIAAIAGGPVAAGNVPHSLGLSFGRHFGAMQAAFTGAPINQGTPVATSDLAAIAAAQAYAAIAAQAQQVASINSQIPHFYGGTGAAGNNFNVPLTAYVPAGFTAIGSSGLQIYNVGTAATDSQTVSAVWNKVLTTSEARTLVLRSNTAGTTYCYAKISLTGDPGAVDEGVRGGTGIHYYSPYDPTCKFVMELGCYVAGVQTVFQTYSYPLWTVDNTGLYQITYPGYYYWLSTANNVFNFEVTAYAFTASLWTLSQTFSDGSHVSQQGSSYRSGGYADSSSDSGIKISWDFYDSGPVSGPAKATVTTSESTSSSSYTDLATTTDQVTVNVGSSGMVLLVVTCQESGNVGLCSYAISGANTQAADDSRGLYFFHLSNEVLQASYTELVTGLNVGATTFKMKYRLTASGTATFANRAISAIPL